MTESAEWGDGRGGLRKGDDPRSKFGFIRMENPALWRAIDDLETAILTAEAEYNSGAKLKLEHIAEIRRATDALAVEFEHNVAVVQSKGQVELRPGRIPDLKIALSHIDDLSKRRDRLVRRLRCQIEAEGPNSAL